MGEIIIEQENILFATGKKKFEKYKSLNPEVQLCIVVIFEQLKIITVQKQTMGS